MLKVDGEIIDMQGETYDLCIELSALIAALIGLMMKTMPEDFVYKSLQAAIETGINAYESDIVRLESFNLKEKS